MLEEEHSCEYGLIGECVVPGYDARDKDFATEEQIRALNPGIVKDLERFFIKGNKK